MASVALRLLNETGEKEEKMISVESANGEASVMMLGAVASIMVTYYLINSSKEIRKEAWSMINLAVSIFLAVLGYTAVNHLVCVIFGFPLELEGIPETGDIVVKGIQLVAWWVYILFMLFINRGSTLKLQAHGTVGGHILGFAAIFFFGYIGSTKFFRSGAPGPNFAMILLLLILWVCLGVLFGLTSFIERKIKNADGVEKEEIAAWHEQSVDTGNDFAAMGTSFLIVFWIRSMLLEEFPTIDGELGAGHDKSMTLLLLGIVGLLLAAVVAVVHHITNFGGFFDYISTTVSTTAAFLMLFALMWKVGESASSELVSMAIVAVILSTMAVFYILAVVFIKKTVAFPEESKVFKALFTGVSLAVGLSWEKVFDAAIEGAADMIASSSETKTAEHLFTVLLSCGLIAIVAPAWILYILPQASEEVKKDYKKALADGPLPVTALCNDEDLSNEYYEGIDDVDEDEP
jgi:hypothetical protein